MSLARRLLAMTAAAVTGLLLTASAATAASEPWSSAPCVTGELSWSDVDVNGQWGVVWGSATQCGPTVENGGFRVVYYPANRAYGEGPDWNARRFASTAVGERVDFVAAVPLPKSVTIPVCLVAGERQRVVCALAAPALGFLSPLDVNAPQVAKDYQGEGYDSDHNPANLPPPNQPGPGPDDPEGVCGTCF